MDTIGNATEFFDRMLVPVIGRSDATMRVDMKSRFSHPMWKNHGLYNAGCNARSNDPAPDGFDATPE